MRRTNTLVGSPVQRSEDRRFLRGEGQYVADLKSERTAYAAILRSSVAHGRLLAIRAEAARALPGVRAIITASDMPSGVQKIPLRQQVLDEGLPFLQPVIANTVVRYVGEPVAVIVADDLSIAEDAAALIEIEIAPLDVVPDMASAAADRILLFPDVGSNRPMTFTAAKGDAGAAFASADYSRRGSFSVQRHGAMPMETRGLFADWNERKGHLTVHGAAKVPFFNRSLLARMLGLEATAVDMMEVDVGGGFGARGEFYPEDFLIPFCAMHVKRPVRWVEDRREHFTAMNHARDMSAEIEIACMRDGTVVGLRGTIHVDLGAYVRTNGFTAPRNAAQFLSGPYHVPNIAVDAAVFVTNKTPAGTYRGPGRFEASFFCERLFDMAAFDLGIDPAEFRRRNLVTEAQMPYKLARMRHIDPSAETECDGGAYEMALDRCLEAFDWKRRSQRQGELIDGRHHGYGLGMFIEGGSAGPREGAKITLNADGTVTVAVGSSALGQGLETVLGQIASDALEVPMDRIRLLHGSTTLVTEGFGSFHSRSTVMGGNAVLVAVEALKTEIRRIASGAFQCAPDVVEVSEGAARHDNRVLTFAELGALGVVAERSFSNSKHTYSYGAHAVHVAVDARTGHVEILDYLTVEDVGRIINPATLHGQVLGAVVQGLGSVFLEQIHYDDQGQILTGSFADYLLPTADDFPNIRSISLALRPCPNNPLGAKGAGEGGLIAVGGAVGNAIAAALRPLGVEPCHLPFSPPRLWQLIEDKRRPAHGTSPSTRTGV
jgi:aerobic carbon-monoxide dehydrogenase large subunit